MIVSDDTSETIIDKLSWPRWPTISFADLVLPTEAVYRTGSLSPTILLWPKDLTAQTCLSPSSQGYLEEETNRVEFWLYHADLLNARNFVYAGVATHLSYDHCDFWQLPARPVSGTQAPHQRGTLCRRLSLLSSSIWFCTCFLKFAVLIYPAILLSSFFAIYYFPPL